VTPLALLRKLGRRTAMLGRYVVNRFVRGIRIERPPVFILGCPHSGTSVLLAILDAHPNLCGIPFESGIGHMEDPGPFLRRFDLFAVQAGAHRWVEKTPDHIRCIDRLLELYPDAPILLIIRDGRDVAFSLKKRHGRVNIRRWMKLNTIGEAYWDHPRVHVLRYEALVTDFSGTMTAILEFIDEPVMDLSDFHEKPRHIFSRTIRKPPDASAEHHNEHRNWQINQPLFDGRGRWKDLEEAEKREIKELGSEMLARYGYVESDDW
jgi:hypothetical protein